MHLCTSNPNATSLWVSYRLLLWLSIMSFSLSGEVLFGLWLWKLSVIPALYCSRWKGMNATLVCTSPIRPKAQKDTVKLSKSSPCIYLSACTPLLSHCLKTNSRQNKEFCGDICNLRYGACLKIRVQSQLYS